MLDAECECFSGRMSRLVNSLSGFTDLVKVEIAENEQIGNVISIIEKRLVINGHYSVEEHKELVEKEMKDREYDDDTIAIWLEYIE